MAPTSPAIGTTITPTLPTAPTQPTTFRKFLLVPTKTPPTLPQPVHPNRQVTPIRPDKSHKSLTITVTLMVIFFIYLSAISRTPFNSQDLQIRGTVYVPYSENSYLAYRQPNADILDTLDLKETVDRIGLVYSDDDQADSPSAEKPSIHENQKQPSKPHSARVEGRGWFDGKFGLRGVVEDAASQDVKTTGRRDDKYVRGELHFTSGDLDEEPADIEEFMRAYGKDLEDDRK